MIGYKATINGRCLDQFYEVGQTYTLNGELIMCANGFHFCQDLYDVFTYYSPNKHTKVFKVETLGEIKIEEDKSVTNKIKILEEVNLSNLIVKKYNNKKYFDDRGYFIKQEYSDGSYYKYEYDNDGNLTKFQNSNGYWDKIEYDENGNKIKVENSNGCCEKFEYNENNHLKNIIIVKG